MIYGLVVVGVGSAMVVFGVVYTFAQRMARRARERADAVVSGEGLDALGAWSVDLLGSTSLARRDIRGVGVLVLTPTSLEFRLGYGSTAVSIPLAAIIGVEVGRTFRITGRLRRYRKPIVLTVHWRGALDPTTGVAPEHVTGFGTHQAAELAARLSA